MAQLCFPLKGISKDTVVISAADQLLASEGRANTPRGAFAGLWSASLLAKSMHIIADSIFYMPIGHCAALQKAVEHAKASVDRANWCSR